MKRIFAALICLLGATAVFAQVNKQAIKERLTPISSADAHKKGVTMITLVVDAEFPGRDDIDNSPIAKKCPAVRIASNTLLASRACIDLSGKGTTYNSQGSAGVKVEENVPVNRWIDHVEVAGQKIYSDKFYQNDRLLAIVVDGNNESANRLLLQMPITDLFVAKDAEKLKTVFPKMTLNRDDMIFNDRTCAEVDIANVCTDNQCFQVCWKAIDGDTGDPVFGRNPKTSKLEYLLGFNVRNSKMNKRQSGRWYHFLSKSSLDFFKQHLPAQEWGYINQHAKDETLYTK